jgi:hypothetical protein
VSTAVYFTFDPHDEGARREHFLAWVQNSGGQVPGSESTYACFGAAGERIEADYHSSHAVTFATFHMGPGMPALAELALGFWAEFGGSMDASEELRGLIRARYQAYSTTQAGD